MVSKRRLDERDIRRRAPRLAPKFRILLVCEGKLTEPEYFKCFQHSVRNPRVHVKLADEPGVPLKVVQSAVRLRDQAAAEAVNQRDDNLRYDSVWAVFDVDEHPNLDRARTLAEDGGIELAISNPCFELWALLHFEVQRAHIEREKVTLRLRTHIPGYVKLLPYEKLAPNYEQARSRAISLSNEAGQHQDCNRNPTTTVYNLTELIRTK